MALSMVIVIHLYCTRRERHRTGISRCLRPTLNRNRTKKQNGYCHILGEQLLSRKSQTVHYYVALIAQFGPESKLARMISFA